MAIKPIIRFLAITGICCATATSFAKYHHKHHSSWKVRPYLGMEYKLSYTKGQEYWSRLFANNKVNHNGSLFAGIKFHKFLGGEVGYTMSNRPTKSSYLGSMRMFNTTKMPAATSVQNIKVSYRTAYLDIVGQYPGVGSFALLGSVGMGSGKPKISVENLGGAANAAISSISGKSKMFPRVGLGVQYTKGMFGVRSKIMWEGTSRLRVNTGSLGTLMRDVTDKPFKSTYAWTLGAFVRW